MCYGSAGRTVAAMYDFSVLAGSPSTYDISGLKVIGVNSIQIGYNTI